MKPRVKFTYLGRDFVVSARSDLDAVMISTRLETSGIQCELLGTGKPDIQSTPLQVGFTLPN